MRLRESGWLERLVTLAALVLSPALATAQDGPRPFVEAGLGVAHGVGGTYATRTGPAVSLTIGTQPHGDRSLLLALHASALNWGGQDDIAPSSGARMPMYPFALAFAALIGGRSLAESGPAIEWMAGPAMLRKVDAGGAWTALVVSARVGAPPGRRVSPGLAIRTIATRGDGTLLVSTQLGFSLRFW